MSEETKPAPADYPACIECGKTEEWHLRRCVDGVVLGEEYHPFIPSQDAEDRLLVAARKLNAELAATAAILRGTKPATDGEREMTTLELLAALDVPMLVGLEAQGHIPTVERMLDDYQPWSVIGREIGWDGHAAADWYGRHYARRELGALRARIAELEAQNTELDDDCQRAALVNQDHEKRIRELLSRIAELELMVGREKDKQMHAALAAEARIAELEAGVAQRRGEFAIACQLRDEALERARRAEARIAELEAQRADRPRATSDITGCCCDQMCPGACDCIVEINELRAALAERTRERDEARERGQVIFGVASQVYADCLEPIAKAFGFGNAEMDDAFVDFMLARATEIASLRASLAAEKERRARAEAALSEVGARAWESGGVLARHMTHCRQHDNGSGPGVCKINDELDGLIGAIRAALADRKESECVADRKDGDRG